MKLLARILISLGILLSIYGGYEIWLQVNPQKLSFANYPYAVDAQSNFKELPKRISIQSVGIDLPIQPSRITNGIWQTTTTGASYIQSSPIPGEVGNSIMYGHNWANLFGPLVKTKPGDKIVIEYMNGSKKEFTVKSTQTVSSQDSSVLTSTQDKRLTLYTCSGWFDEKRFVVTATLN